MQVPSGIGTSSQKVYNIGRLAGINSVSNDIVTLTQPHQLFNGEKIRIYSDNGNMPSNLENNKVYYAITTGLNPDQIKISATFNDANSGNNITGISNGGGVVKIISSVSDKVPGDYGHPIQWDNSQKQWYILGSKVCSSIPFMMVLLELELQLLAIKLVQPLLQDKLITEVLRIESTKFVM